MPGMVGHLHLHQHVAGEELPLRTDLRAPPNLDDVLGRHHDFLDQVTDVLEVGLLADRLGDLLLETGIGVDHVPARRHRQPPSPSSVRMPNDSIWSTTKKTMAAAKTITKTIARSEEHTSELPSLMP